MKSHKILPWTALVAGMLMAVVGFVFCAMYFVEGIFKRLGESDQSLIFWYLPVLFIGIFGILTGLGLAAWARRRLG